MRIYHFINQQYGVRALEDRRLKVARLHDLNDPFELLAIKGRTPEERRAMRALRTAMSKDIGLLCFSKDWSNPVQWSHYADKHKGFCLGLDLPDEALVEVQYQLSRADISEAVRRKISSGDEELKKKFAIDVISRLLTIKYKHWSYEKEVRSFVKLGRCLNDNDLFFCEFSDQFVLRELIVGAECKLSRIEVDDLLRPYVDSVQVSKARLAFNSFKVVRLNRPELWK